MPKRVDPVEAALARAISLSANTPVLTIPARPAAARDGLASLHRHTRRADALALVDRSPGRAPSAETVVHLGVQPLDPRLVSKLVTERLPAVHYCHESQVARGLGEAGQVNLHFVVEPRGFVSNITITAGGAHADELEACIARQIRRWKFPAADAPTVVDYPIVFDLAGQNLAP